MGRGLHRDRTGPDKVRSPDAVMRELARGAASDGDLVALLINDKTSTRWVTLYVGRVYVSGLLATPALPGGFGPLGDAGAPAK